MNKEKKEVLDLDGLKELVNNIKNVISTHVHKYAGSATEGGAANSAVKLETARNIGKASFDGTANITLAQMGAAEIAELDEIYAHKTTLTTATLYTSKWTGTSAPYSYTLSIPGVTESSLVEISYTSTASEDAIKAYHGAGFRDGGQSTDEIVILSMKKPTVNIPIIVVISDVNVVEGVEPEPPKTYMVQLVGYGHKTYYFEAGESVEITVGFTDIDERFLCDDGNGKYSPFTPENYQRKFVDGNTIYCFTMPECNVYMEVVAD